MTVRPSKEPRDEGAVPPRLRQLEVLSSLGATSGASLHRGILADGTPVLVKRADGGDPRAAAERLRRERELLELLARAGVGPHPVALLPHPVAPALVLEDRPGELLDRLVAARRLDTAECLAIGIDVAAALAELHAARLVYRDLRPANVLAGCRDGGSRMGACLLDVGRALREGSPLLAEVGDDLAYLAPERTGRIGREVDARSDLYSLGVLLYLLLTGSLPFSAHDLLGWVHCHVARQPRAPSEGGPVPRAVSDVVMKLLAKLPDDRYQSAQGVRADLEQCLEQHRTGVDRPITLGERDFSGRFQLPSRFYGREPELDVLLRAYRHVAGSGDTALVLIAGPSGIGKTSLVDELRRRLADERVHFGAGKFDRDRRGSPHSTLGTALGGVVQQILSASEEEVARWRGLLLEALGSQGRLLTEVVPQLGLLLGPQPPVPELPPQEAQKRFARLWQRLLSVLARAEHRLVLFLDDLQWADAETLSLIEYVAAEPGTRHLLLVGAYRNDELDASHPLSRTVDALRKAGVIAQTILPGPFSLEDATRLVVDALASEPGRCEALARLVHARTGGNPFFLLHLLSTLVDEGLIAFQRAGGAWTWDLARIQARQDGDDPAALVSERLRQLPEPTRRVLRLAGMLGNGSRLETLALVDGRPREESERDLSQAVDRGLVRLGADGTFAFPHDRVQQAARDLVPEEERPRVHQAIGRAMLAAWGGLALGDRVFDVVSHLWRAGPLLAAQERIRLAELELEAGRRAEAGLAYPSATRHFAEGQELLPADAWGSHHALGFELALGRARCEWLTGGFGAAEEWVAVLFREARSRAERTEAYRLRVDLLTTRNDVEGALRAALEACALYGLEFPLHPSPDVLGRSMSGALEALGDRSIEQLLDAPEMEDPEQRALVALCSSAAPTAFFVDPMLHNLMLCEVVRLSFRHGGSPHSSHALASFALSVGVFLGRWDDAFRFSKVACTLAERHRTGSVGCWFVAGLLERQVHPPADAIPPLRAGWRAAVDGGDVNHGCQAGFVLAQTRLAAGEPLADVAEEVTRQLEFARSARYFPIHDAVLAQDRLVESLRGGTARLGSFEGPGFDAAAFEARLTPQFPYLPESYFGYRALAELIAGDFAAALASAERVRPFAQDGPIATNEYYRYVLALAACGRHDQVPEAERTPLREVAVESREWLRARAARNPRTFTASVALVSAEAARLEGRDADAIRGFDEAIAAARREGYLHLEAMACEIAARFYRQRGSSLAAAAHLRDACDAYRRWGASAKVQALVAAHPELQSGPAGGAEAGGAAVQQLDLLAAARASQAISGEMSSGSLLVTLLRTVVEAAGAQSGWLLLDGGADLALTARATVHGADIDVEVTAGSPASAADLPASILSYTRRTRQPVVVWDAAAPNPYSGDAALRRRGARSVVCLPILRRGGLQGLLYLENDLVPSAFTPERLALLELLAAQAAISLELSRHREQLEQLVASRTAELTRANDSLRAANRKLELAHRQLLHSEKMASIGRLAAGVAHEINNPVAYVASNLKALEGYLREFVEAASAREAPAPEAGGRPGDQRLEALRAELGSVIGDTRFGLDRVTTIVRALRIFSHAGETDWQVAEVRSGIDSTLHLLRNDLDRKAVVVVEHGEAPPIECIPPELGQVFMNVLLNAVQAIPDRGTITVRSGAAGDEVWIEVSDTGAGISPENLSRIFDPFFTTKPVGEGTGLGLSLAYGIVEKHHGRIDVSSELGKGSTFRIWLPIRQPGSQRA